MTWEKFGMEEGAGRPRIARLRTREGVLSMHVQHSDGSLWMFLDGPRGADHGRVVLPSEYARHVLAWSSDPQGSLPGGGTLTLWLGSDRMRFKPRAVRSRRLFTLTITPEERTEFLMALGGWALLAYGSVEG